MFGSSKARMAKFKRLNLKAEGYALKASGTISGYQIAHNGALTLLPGSTPAGGPSAGAVDARLSPDGGFLYVDQSKTDAVAAFAVASPYFSPLDAQTFAPVPAW